MKILSLESSAKPASAAVIEDGRLLSLEYRNTGLTHSQTLLPMAAAALTAAGLAPADIDVFAVVNGPGSFTGIRIGVASVKGLAQPFNTPCVGVSTLEAIAYPFMYSNSRVIALMDARCSQFYEAEFISDGKTLARVSEDDAILISELDARVSSYGGDTVIFAGDGALPAYTQLHEKHPNIILAPEGTRYQRADSAAFIALREAEAGNTVSYGELCPVYLRVPQAERELKAKRAEPDTP